jgi:transcriptional regulator
MYQPKQFEETRPEVMHAFIRRQPLGALVVPTAEGLEVNHIPFLVVDDNVGPLGLLEGHVARANPLWQRAAGQAVAIFQGPDHYITPSWYPSKEESGGKAVPTWNYVVVHAHGTPRFIDDAGWLRGHVERLVATHEAGRATPWRVTDAPADYIEKLLGQIVGFQLPVTRLEGKWKLGQNRADADRAGMVRGLHDEGHPTAVALAELIGKG